MSHTENNVKNLAGHSFLTLALFSQASTQTPYKVFDSFAGVPGRPLSRIKLLARNATSGWRV